MRHSFGRVCAGVIDAFLLWFRVMMPHECVGDHDETTHSRNLKGIKGRCLDVIGSAAAITAIERWRQPNNRS
jgi:maleamate amidohydrolase